MKNKKIVFLTAGIIVLLIVVILVLHFAGTRDQNSRKNSIKDNDLKKIEQTQHIQIKRYEQDLFSLDTNSLAAGVERLSQKYPEYLIAKDVWKDHRMLAQLKAYITDPVILELYHDVMRIYPDFEDVQAELNRAMSYFLTYFPDQTIPSFYSIVPGLDSEMPTVYGYGDDIFINIDMYLGPSYKFYSQIGMPLFVSQRCDKKYLALDCFRKAMVYRVGSNKTLISLLDNIIYEGKRIYFTELMFPDREEADIIGYTDEKYQWAEANQGQVWRYIIEKNLLFSKQNEVVRQFVGDSPFTKPFNNESPGRMGVFIGWKIVQKYMESHPEVTLAQLMKEEDAQKILNQSGYKPHK